MRLPEDAPTAAEAERDEYDAPLCDGDGMVDVPSRRWFAAGDPADDGDRVECDGCAACEHLAAAEPGA